MFKDCRKFVGSVFPFGVSGLHMYSWVDCKLDVIGALERNVATMV